MLRKSLLTATLLAAMALPAAAQNKTTLYDSTYVVMEESGLSHVTNHQRVRANNFAGCAELATLKVDYDPLSAYVEFQQVIVHHANGDAEDVLLRVYDYVAPARLIYWGASQKMVEVGHLDPGDEVEFITYNIILLVLIIVCVILMARIAYLCQWGKRIKWFFEDICHWLGWDIGSYKEEPEDDEK